MAWELQELVKSGIPRTPGRLGLEGISGDALGLMQVWVTCWTNALPTLSLGLCVAEFPSPASLLVHNYSSFVLCRDDEVDPLHSNYFCFLNFSLY